MHRLLGVLVAVVALGTLAMFHGTTSAAADRQLICHVADDHGARIIEVATTAVPNHLEKHGDCLINSTDRSLIGKSCNPTDANKNDICDVQP